MNDVSFHPGADQCLSASCHLATLRAALQAARTTASYAPAHALYLVAEPPDSLCVLAACEGMTLRYRVQRSQVSQGGAVELSFRACLHLLRQLERSRRELGLLKRGDCPVRVTTDAVGARKRTFLTFTVALLVPPYAHTCVVDASSLAQQPSLDLLHLLEARLAEEAAEGRLSSHALKSQLQRCTIAARSGLPVPPGVQLDPAPYYGVLLSLQPPDEAEDAQGRSGWGMACTAQGPHQLATARERLFHPPVPTGAAPLPAEILLPSWASCELAAHLPVEGDVQLRVGQGWAAFHTATLDVLAEFVQDRPAAIPRPAAPPAAHVAVNGPRFLRALKQTTKRLLAEGIGDTGMAPDRRLITLILDPEQGTLDILPEVAGYDAPPFQTSLPLQEGRGTARRIVVATWDIERAIAPLRGSVLLAFYDSEEHFPLTIRPFVPTGFQCWLQARTRPARRTPSTPA
jgi:hypothetical protein